MGQLQRILVVDDDPYNRNLLKAILESLGYEADLTESGVEALGKLKSNLIDLVLLDVMMPDLDGYEVARRIRDDPAHGDIPIIMVTILDGKDDRLRAIEAGANDFISKPIDVLELRVRMASLLKMKNAQDRIKASLSEKAVLLREIHHRVKNNLAVVSSLLRLQSRYAADEFHRKMFLDAQNRVRSMALVHEKLYQTDNLAAVKMTDYVRSLVDHLVASCRALGKQIQVIKKVEDISLGLQTVVPLGIILTELVSNGLQHAFPDETEGEICVSLRSIDEEKFGLIVKDNGVGMPDDVDCSNPRSFGLSLVKIFLQQLNGTMQIDTSEGTEFSLELRDVGRGAKKDLGGPDVGFTHPHC